jgi:hypothetical protein
MDRIHPAVLDDLLPSAWRHVEQYANNPVEAAPQWLQRYEAYQPVHPDSAAIPAAAVNE